MNFSLALIYLECGKSVRRKAWKKNKLICIARIPIKKSKPLLVTSLNGIDFSTWQPRNKDITAEDWEEVT